MVMTLMDTRAASRYLPQ